MTVPLNSGDGYFGRAKYDIACTYARIPATRSLEARFNGWYVGNILFGGLIGLLIVDPLTGAMWRLDENVNVTFPNQ